MFMSLKY